MNYSQYLQTGGQISAEDKTQMQQDEVKEKSILELFKANPEEFLKSIPEEDLPSMVAFIMDKGAKFEDTDALNLIAPIAEKLGINGTNAFKCGGKVAKKVRKHACGKKIKKSQEGDELEKPILEEKCGGKAKKAKKAEFGIKLPKESKGGCPCKKLMKVGGKIVEVGCDDMPIAKLGMKIHYTAKVDNTNNWLSTRTEIVRDSTLRHKNGGLISYSDYLK